MHRSRTTLGNERGVALALALMMMLALTGLLCAFLSVSALEPQISDNLAASTKTRYLAEAGIEVGFNILVNTPDFSTVLNGATAANPWVTLVNAGTLSAVTAGGANAESTFAGTYTVIVRNDSRTADSSLTGVAAGTTAVPNETLTLDSNRIVIMRSTGTFGGATKTIEVVVRRAPVPVFPGAVNLPGAQDDTFINKTNFDIDGRDYRCITGCDTAANWTTNASNPNKWGIATQTGTQTNVNKAFERNVEDATLTSGSCDASCTTKRASIKGRDETVTDSSGPSSFTTGVNTIQADSALNSTMMADYLNAIRTYPGTTVLQSTQACPMVLTGTTTPTNTPTLTNGCTGSAGVNKPLNLGTRDDPKVVYFKGDIDSSSTFTGLQLNQGIKGAGILIVEDGDMRNLGNFTWDGVVLITGSYVGSASMAGSSTTIRGAYVINETQPGEAAGFFEFYLDAAATNFSIRSSKQNLDMITLMKGAHTITNWQEF
jgi:hypothetical protein